MGNQLPLDTHTPKKDKEIITVLQAEEAEVVDIPSIEDQSGDDDSSSKSLDEASIHTDDEEEGDVEEEDDDEEEDEQERGRGI